LFAVLVHERAAEPDAQQASAIVNPPPDADATDATEIVAPLTSASPLERPVYSEPSRRSLLWIPAAAGALVAVAGMVVLWPSSSELPAQAAAAPSGVTSPAPLPMTNQVPAADQSSGLQATMRDYENAKQAEEASETVTDAAVVAPEVPVEEQAPVAEQGPVERAAAVEPAPTNEAEAPVASAVPEQTVKLTKSAKTPKRTSTKPPAKTTKRTVSKKPVKKPAKHPPKWNPDDLFLDDK
jgi:hypothetical protein